MTVTTLIKKPFDLFQVFLISASIVGILYSGNSNINGSASVLKAVLFKNNATTIAITIPTKYSDVVTKAALCGKNIATNSAYIGSFAPQVISGAIRAVTLLSFSLSNVLVAIIAGEEHPIPITIGIKALPDRPTFLITLSIKNAVLDMYPLSSNNDIPKNNVNIKGKNGKVPPTPPIIPSTISDLNHGLELDSILLTGAEI